MHPEFAALLNQALAQNHRSGSWLARQLGIDPSTVARWRNGDSRPKNPETIIRISDILGIHQRMARQRLIIAAGYAYVETIDETNTKEIKQIKEYTVLNSPQPETTNGWIGKHREVTILGLFFLCGLSILCWQIRSGEND